MSPKIGKDVFLADGATLIGNIEIGDRSSVWYNAVLRGDVNPIRIGHDTNVQDGVIIHTSRNLSVSTIGDFVTIGHGAIIHGAIIEDYVLIGMGAVILDNAHIHTGAIIAAGAVITAGQQVPPYTLWAGCPAKQIKTLDPDTALKKNHENAAHYVEYSTLYLDPCTNTEYI